jgi:hypothetical protein
VRAAGSLHAFVFGAESLSRPYWYAEIKTSSAAARATIDEQSARLVAAVETRQRALFNEISLLEKQKLAELEDRRLTTAISLSRCQLVIEEGVLAGKLSDTDVAALRASLATQMKAATDVATALRSKPAPHASVQLQLAVDQLLRAVLELGVISGERPVQVGAEVKYAVSAFPAGFVLGGSLAASADTGSSDDCFL